jgi:ketosteroid isomerase-like protein
MDRAVEIEGFARSFFDAIETGDMETVRGSFAPGAEIWHNTDEQVVTAEETMQVLAGLVTHIRNRRYADRRLMVVPDGFWQQHVLTGERIADGGKVRLPCAIFCRVVDGKITRIDEYFDSAHVAAFRRIS